MFPSRLGTASLMDISLMERYSDHAAAALWLAVSFFFSSSLRLSGLAKFPLFSSFHSLLSPSFIPALLALPHIVYLTHHLPLSHLHPSSSRSPPVSHPHSALPHLSLSHTLVATLKTVVTMVTAMCCGNVKEPNPPRMTSLFNTYILSCFTL